MTDPSFDLDAYLERVECSDVTHATEQALEALQRAQLATIPFENFDILLGRGISVAPEAIVEKLVHRARGGYCFELNGLHVMALKALGFDARPLLARVHLSGSPSGRSHQLSLVTIRRRQWITDVGFGGQTIRAPIPLELDEPITHDRETYRLTTVKPWGIMLQAQHGDTWQDLYSFDLGHVCPADIEVANHFTATHPSSFFTFARVAALQSREGIVTLYNTTLKSVTGDGEHIEEIAAGEAFLTALRSRFRIELDATYADLRALPEPPVEPLTASA
jgi:N-hydroxyarylamine O-acetyltransferase